ncbi:hypothetical protein CJF30_00010659 [Rutstroemia sp. NJR-2017a BBW]|nr:hypothetical protein CJF30_00010659 [Rutstroemia sp. NJR-2017a BBW]
MTVHLGPVAPLADPAPPRNPRSDGFGDNPRCLRRDLGPYLTSNYATTSIIASLITTHNSIGPFQDAMQIGSPQGVHGAAHFTIGSDPGGDFYTSPNDPAFWLLHGMIDRVWYIWQIQDLQNRMQRDKYVWGWGAAEVDRCGQYFECGVENLDAERFDECGGWTVLLCVCLGMDANYSSGTGFLIWNSDCFRLSLIMELFRDIEVRVRYRPCLAISL